MGPLVSGVCVLMLAKYTNGKGFTIVELLIVIVVIAVLAAVTIVAFNGIQQRARASAAMAALSQSKKKLEVYKVENGAYPTTGNLASAGISSGDTTLQYTSNGTTFCITGTNGNVSYKTTESAATTSGGCAGHGQGGVAAVTNLVTNPSIETNLTSIFGIASGVITRETNASAVSGSYVVKTVTPGTVGNEGAGVSLAANPFGTYTGSAYVWGSGSVRTWMRFGYTDSTYTEGTYSGTYTLTGSPQRIETTSTFPDNGKTPSYLQMFVRTNPVQATTFYMDGFMVTTGGLATYADGTSTDWVWNGTAHGSTSTGPAL